MNSIKLIFLGFLCTWMIFSCNSQAEESKEVDAKTVKSAPTEVAVATSQVEDFQYIIEANGKVEPAYEIKLVSERGGALVDLKVKEGDFVRKGSLIAQLDAQQAALDVAKAEVQVQKTKVEYDLQAENMDLVRKRMEVDEDLLLGNVRARTGLKEAELALEEARLNLSKSRIIAPADGQIANLKVKTGAFLGVSDEIGYLLSTHQLLVRLKILETDLPMIRGKVKAHIYPVSGNGKDAMIATLHSINPQVDENGMVGITLEIASSKELIPGMNVRAEIMIPDKKALLVPKDALVFRSGKPVVFTVKDGMAKWNYVSPGKNNGRMVEIIEGLEENQTVIISNNLQIAHDAAVTIIEDDKTLD